MHAIATDLQSRSRSHLSIAGGVEASVSVSCPEMFKRALLTLLFTDIVESTKLIEQLGDEAWYRLHMQHNTVVRARLAAFGGREVKCAGDGFFAVFQTPILGIHCAAGIRSSLQALGMRIRCGLHTSECLVEGSRVSGLAVHIAARIASAARPNEILVSRAVKDLAAGADVQFVEGHVEALRGLSGEQELFTVKA